jgi:hypothetical protein
VKLLGEIEQAPVVDEGAAGLAVRSIGRNPGDVRAARASNVVASLLGRGMGATGGLGASLVATLFSSSAMR